MRRTLGLSVIALCVLLVGCDHREFAEATETRIVEAGGAESARIDVQMGAGELRLDAGSTKLLDADFRFPEGARPEVKYDLTGKRGFLVVRQPSITGIGPHGKTTWDIRVTDRIPLDLRVNFGAGEGKMRLAGLALRSLEVSMGAGELDIDLNGPWDKDLDAHVSGGVGEATVRLPQKVGVRVKASGGIGEIKVQGLEKRDEYYYNDAWGKTDARIRLDVSGGIGQINIIG